MPIPTMYAASDVSDAHIKERLDDEEDGEMNHRGFLLFENVRHEP
jgi:hypothetical protein